MTTKPYLTTGRPGALAHRGDRAGHPPGNRRSAFASAVALGFDHIESDVHVSRDGVAVLFHDDVLDNETDGTGTIADHSWTDLATLRYRTDGTLLDEGLVRLDDVLAEWPDVHWNLDAKDRTAVDALLASVARAAATERVLATSFSLGAVRALRREGGPALATGMAKLEIAATRLASWTPLPVPASADAAQVPREHRGVPVADERFVRACHGRNIHVHVWTVNQPDEMHRLLDLGVDGLITDDPALLRSVLVARGEW